MADYDRRGFLKGLGVAATTVGATGCSTLYKSTRAIGNAIGFPVREGIFNANKDQATVTIKRGDDKLVCVDNSRTLSLYNGIPDRAIVTTDGVTRTYDDQNDIRAHCDGVWASELNKVKSYISDTRKAIKSGEVKLGKTEEGKPIGLEAVVNLPGGIEVTIKKDKSGNTAYLGITKYDNEVATVDGVPRWLKPELKGLASEAIRKAESPLVKGIVGTSTISN